MIHLFVMIAILYNKPVNTVTTHRDQVDQQCAATRRTVYESIDLPDEICRQSLHAVGRLDVKTSGLLILTDDGNLVHQISNPSSPGVRVLKTYRALCMNVLSREQIHALRAGVDLQGGLGLSAPASVDVVEVLHKKTVLDITISEGKNRQIRRMLHSIGSGVMRLERRQIGHLTLDGIEESGSWRILADREIQDLLM